MSFVGGRSTESLLVFFFVAAVFLQKVILTRGTDIIFTDRKEMSYFKILLGKDHLSFFVSKVRPYFKKK